MPQDVVVINPPNHPVQASLPGVVRAKLVEPERWAIAFSLGIVDPATGSGSTTFQSTRPILVEMVAADRVPLDGYLTVESEPIPVPPTEPHASASTGGAGEYTKGAMFKIPIQNGVVPPTPLVLPVQSIGASPVRYEFQISVQPKTLPAGGGGMYDISVVGRFLD